MTIWFFFSYGYLTDIIYHLLLNNAYVYCYIYNLSLNGVLFNLFLNLTEHAYGLLHITVEIKARTFVHVLTYNQIGCLSWSIHCESTYSNTRPYCQQQVPHHCPHYDTTPRYELSGAYKAWGRGVRGLGVHREQSKGNCLWPPPNHQSRWALALNMCLNRKKDNSFRQSRSL